METDRKEREVRRRREEQRRLAKRRQVQKKEKNRKTRNAILAIMLCILLLGGIVTAAFTFLFPVKTIEVVGNQQYTKQAVISAAAITEGSNLLRLNPQTVESSIRSQCPYIIDVQLQRKLPNRVIITVKEGGPTLAFAAGDNYVLTTAVYEYIETIAQSKEATVVYGIAVTSGMSGQPVTFTDSQLQAQLDQLMKELTAQSITDITKIDFTDPSNVRLQYKQQHIWELGDLNNLSYKLQFGYAVSQQEGETGTVDLSWLNPSNKDAYFKSEVLGDFMGEDEKYRPAVSIRHDDGYVIMTADLTYVEQAESAKGHPAVFGTSVAVSSEDQSVTFNDSTQKDVLLALIKELNSQSVGSVEKIDLSNLQNIRLQYKELHIWELGSSDYLSDKLSLGKEISQEQTETGTLDLSAVTDVNSNAAFQSEELADITVPEESGDGEALDETYE